MNIKPQMKVERTQVERLLEIAGLAGIAFVVSFLIKYWASLPDTVPSHFGYDGRPDAFSGKSFLLILPAVAVFSYTILTFLSRYPHILNYLWKITHQNAYRQYQLSRTMITALKAETIWIFNYIVYIQVRVSLEISSGLSPLFLPILIIAVLGTIGLYLFFSYKER